MIALNKIKLKLCKNRERYQNGSSDVWIPCFVCLNFEFSFDCGVCRSDKASKRRKKSLSLKKTFRASCKGREQHYESNLVVEFLLCAAWCAPVDRGCPWPSRRRVLPDPAGKRSARASWASSRCWSTPSDEAHPELRSWQTHRRSGKCSGSSGWPALPVTEQPEHRPFHLGEPVGEESNILILKVSEPQRSCERFQTRLNVRWTGWTWSRSLPAASRKLRWKGGTPPSCAWSRAWSAGGCWTAAWRSPGPVCSGGRLRSRWPASCSARERLRTKTRTLTQTPRESGARCVNFSQAFHHLISTPIESKSKHFTFNHSQRIQVCWGSRVDSENFLGVPDHPGQVARQHHLQAGRNITDDKDFICKHITPEPQTNSGPPRW